jgi:putative transcriptional regulator
VLIIQHDGDGASGLVLNRASNTKIGELLSDEVDLPTPEEQVYVGGPVEGPLMAIHGCVSLAEKDILDNVFFSLRRDNLLGIVGQTLRPYRLFCGYSGWGPDQLDQEIAVGGWLVVPATADLVFGPAENLWQSVSDQIGLEIIFSRRFEQPSDPSAN